MHHRLWPLPPTGAHNSGSVPAWRVRDAAGDKAHHIRKRRKRAEEARQKRQKEEALEEEQAEVGLESAARGAPQYAPHPAHKCVALCAGTLQVPRYAWGGRWT